jgi:undecaprenyl-diphosphatase
MAIEQYFHSLWQNRALDSLARVTADYGLYICFAVLAIAWVRRPPRGALVPFGLGAAVAALAVFIAGALHDESRPFAMLHVAPLVPHGLDNAFPSDHSAAAAYVSTVVAFLDLPLAIVAWIATIALGLARSYCLLHTPLDVFAGWILGALPAVAAGVYWRKRWTTASSPPDLT